MTSMLQKSGWQKEEMAKQVITRIKPESTVNLGIGLPTLIAELIPEEMGIFIHSENGVLGVAGRPCADEVSPTLINAGKETISIRKGASFFDSALSFGMIRGGHVDYCVLGAFEVDVEGNLANWMVPGQKVAGIGGAMDLATGAKEVVVMMNHFNKNGSAKMVERCTLPLTGCHVVHLIVTDLGVFRPRDGKFSVEELAPHICLEDLGIPLALLTPNH